MTAVRLQVQRLNEELKVLTSKVKAAQTDFRNETSAPMRNVCEAIWRQAVEDKQEITQERGDLALKYAKTGTGNSRVQWVISQLNEELSDLALEVEEAGRVYVAEEPDTEKQAVCHKIWQQLIREKKELIKARRAVEDLYKATGDDEIAGKVNNSQTRDSAVASPIELPKISSFTQELEDHLQGYNLEDYVFMAMAGDLNEGMRQVI